MSLTWDIFVPYALVMSKQLLRDLSLVGIGFIVAIAFSSVAQKADFGTADSGVRREASSIAFSAPAQKADFGKSESSVRIEGSVGYCQHHLAPDSSWSYRDWGQYQTHMNIKPKCGQLGLSILPFESGGVKLGFRVAYVDLGTIRADNTYPVDEPAYFHAKETGTPVKSETARFQGVGRSRGLTLGLAAESRAYGIDVGGEGGLALLRNTWHVEFPGGATTQAGCRTDWACADSNQVTPYVGVNVRYGYVFLSVRKYMSVHASNSGEGIRSLFIGPTAGPTVQATVGLSIPL